MFCFNSKKVGYVKKTHGINGEVVVSFLFKIPKKFSIEEWVFLKYEGILIPFLVEYYQVLDEWSVLFKFKQLHTIEEAKRFVLSELFVDAKTKWLKETEISYIGYQVFDKEKVSLGTIVNFLPINNNPLIETKLATKKILIPFNPATIKKIDHFTQSIYLSLLKNELTDD